LYLRKIQMDPPLIQTFYVSYISVIKLQLIFLWSILVEEFIVLAAGIAINWCKWLEPFFLYFTDPKLCAHEESIWWQDCPWTYGHSCCKTLSPDLWWLALCVALIAQVCLSQAWLASWTEINTSSGCSPCRCIALEALGTFFWVVLSICHF